MCDCVHKVNEAMKDAGKGGSVLTLTIPIDGGQQKPMLQVGRRDAPWKKPLQGNPQFVIPSYCPFCGEQWSKD